METFLLYVTGIASAVAFVAFGVDKLLAKAGMWRVPEAVLLLISFFGGAAGALAGMALFRHKTKKGKFTVTVPMMFLFHLAVLGAVFF